MGDETHFLFQSAQFFFFLLLFFFYLFFSQSLAWSFTLSCSLLNFMTDLQAVQQRMPPIAQDLTAKPIRRKSRSPSHIKRGHRLSPTNGHHQPAHPSRHPRSNSGSPSDLVMTLARSAIPVAQAIHASAIATPALAKLPHSLLIVSANSYCDSAAVASLAAARMTSPPHSSRTTPCASLSSASSWHPVPPVAAPLLSPPLSPGHLLPAPSLYPQEQHALDEEYAFIRRYSDPMLESLQRCMHTQPLHTSSTIPSHDLPLPSPPHANHRRLIQNRRSSSPVLPIPSEDLSWLTYLSNRLARHLPS
ncbi:hypothetical protein DM01DRAFT_1208494 [Hesseltinella vesiculosa]|uniref:Uncharacterized protein n=1 Tax=Hesseltinella vesiculosa TaxID=101127 RepID=A0A1X2GRG3_9FUNG|nr:hypothetical protein DM01DRAFT_1208494 [Hesseltinella vesiculosa]